MKKKINYKDVLAKSAAKAKQEQDDAGEKPATFQDVKNREAKKSWEERRFAHDRGQKQKNYFERISFKQFLVQEATGPVWGATHECEDCGDQTTDPLTGECYCGAKKWVEMDLEPREHDGEPEESWQERNQRLLRRDGIGRG